jgi:SAM-dependent methyltransferase
MFGALRPFARAAYYKASFTTQKLFGLAPEGSRALGRVVAHNRVVLAARYLRGDGIEIGGLGRPLMLSAGARVKFVDRYDEDGLRGNYPEMAGVKIVRPDIVDDGETLATIPDASQDFVVVNHVVEHFQDPIRFFHNANRVLKPGGVLFMALPDRDKTFDRARPVTPFEHLVHDYDHGPAGSREEHFREFVRLADTHNGTQAWRTEAEYEALVAKLMADDYSIHFHVWDLPGVLDMLLQLRRRYALVLRPLAVLSSGDEVVSVLEKSAS